MPAFLLPTVTYILEHQAVPFLEWLITGSVRLIERRHKLAGTQVPSKLCTPVYVAAMPSPVPGTEKPATPKRATGQSA